MTTVSKVLEIAKNEVGYCRYDDPERGTKYGRWYADLVGDKAYGANGVAYCAMFASWVLAQAGVECDGMPGAYCPSIHHSQTLKASELKAGDLVLFDWEDDGTDDHIGIVASNDKSAKQVKTVEGNTSGGRVAERTRAYSTICGGIRPRYGKAQASAEPAAKAVTKALVEKVVNGDYGNEPMRSRNLEARGYDPKAVQLAVNAHLRGESFGAQKPAEKKATWEVTAKSGLNVREKAGTKYRAVGTYAKGSRVTVTATENVSGDTWGKTPKGWIALKYRGESYARKC